MLCSFTLPIRVPFSGPEIQPHSRAQGSCPIQILHWLHSEVWYTEMLLFLYDLRGHVSSCSSTVVTVLLPLSSHHLSAERLYFFAPIGRGWTIHPLNKKRKVQCFQAEVLGLCCHCLFSIFQHKCGIVPDKGSALTPYPWWGCDRARASLWNTGIVS